MTSKICGRAVVKWKVPVKCGKEKFKVVTGKAKVLTGSAKLETTNRKL